MNNVLIINKPKGITSHDVVNIVRRKVGVKKVGHAGTLDPLAEGVLIVLVGEATKKQSEFMGLEKEYVAEIALGIRTDTYDVEGTVVEDAGISGREIDDVKLKKVLDTFIGEIEQEVPPYSAVKIKGKALYKYAREKKLKNIKLPKRKVFIKDIEFLGSERKKVRVGSLSCYLTFSIRVVCSKGTYIRSLANDIGNILGCGATLLSLVRTRIGNYTLKCSMEIL